MFVEDEHKVVGPKVICGCDKFICVSWFSLLI